MTKTVKLNVDWKVWRRNCLTLFASLACAAAATTIVYHRTWELWMPEEPAHGSPILRYAHRGYDRTDGSRLRAAPFRVAAVLRDGRLWLRGQRVRPQEIGFGGYRFVCHDLTGSPWRSGFVDGSWRDVAVTTAHCFAIQADGSLWDLSEVDPEAKTPRPRRFVDGPGWQSIAAGESTEYFIGLKNDGTLWEWGAKPVALNSGMFSLEKIQGVAQIGTDHDWQAVCGSSMGAVAVKQDGSVWHWGYRSSASPAGGWTSKVGTHPERWLSGPAENIVSLTVREMAVAVVLEDGTLWVGGYLPFGIDNVGRSRRELVRFDNSSDWKDVAFTSQGKLAATRKGGSLWEWTHAYGRNFGPVLLSQYSDWMVVAPHQDGFLALAWDGTLCRWKNSDDRAPFRTHHFDRNAPFRIRHLDPNALLVPSRIKATKIAELQ